VGEALLARAGELAYAVVTLPTVSTYTTCRTTLVNIMLAVVSFIPGNTYASVRIMAKDGHAHGARVLTNCKIAAWLARTFIGVFLAVFTDPAIHAGAPVRVNRHLSAHSVVFAGRAIAFVVVVRTI
jgi:uncharacterized membrane protein YqaE (UPF0057 family)